MNNMIEIIERSIPEIKVLKKLTSGGQKDVYSIQNGEDKEALKLIQIPKIDHPDSDSIQAEIKGRVLREIEVLEKCTAPEIVKLGKLKPQVINLEGFENIIYSEELIEGDDLWVLIQNPASPKPSEVNKFLWKQFILTIVASIAPMTIKVNLGYELKVKRN